MEEYRKIDDDIFERIGPVERISLSELEKRLVRLQKQQETPKPSNDELLASARVEHPYYRDRQQIEAETVRLRLLIQRLKSL